MTTVNKNAKRRSTYLLYTLEGRSLKSVKLCVLWKIFITDVVHDPVLMSLEGGTGRLEVRCGTAVSLCSLCLTLYIAV